MPAYTQANYVAWTPSGNGYNLTLQGTTASITLFNADYQWLRNTSTNVGYLYGMPLFGSEVQAFARMTFYNYGVNAITFSPTLSALGTGDSADQAMNIQLLTTNTIEDDTLAAYAARFFSFQAPQNGTYTIAVTDGVAYGTYGTVTPLFWDLFTDPNDPVGSMVWQCSPTPNPSNPTRWDTMCSPTLQSGTAYYLKVYETLGNGNVHYQLTHVIPS